MKRLTVITLTLVLTLATLALPAAAQASPFLTQGRAARITADVARSEANTLARLINYTNLAYFAPRGRDCVGIGRLAAFCPAVVTGTYTDPIIGGSADFRCDTVIRLRLFRWGHGTGRWNRDGEVHCHWTSDVYWAGVDQGPAPRNVPDMARQVGAGSSGSIR